jgi:transcriptional regulator with XRE-family HTH domain
MPAMMVRPAKDFAGVLWLLRRRARMTQDELAKAARVGTPTVSALERGVNKSTHKTTAERLADALSLTGDEREQFLAAALGRLTPAETAAWAEALEKASEGASGAAPAGAGGLDDDADASNLGWIESAVSGELVGRAAELGVLREAWSRAAGGRRVLALIGGQAGVGKTALTAELARLVHDGGGLVLYGRWDESAATYQAFREALTDYARACPQAQLRLDLRDLPSEVAHLCPEAAPWIAGSATQPLASAQADRFRLFESLDTWFQRMSARQLVLLVLDDLQWADQSSLRLLTYLMRRARRPAPLLVVAMYGDDELGRSDLPAALPSLERDIDCRRLPLRGLTGDDVTTLLDAAIDRRDLETVRELERLTKGNPLFLLEMARHWSERGGSGWPAARLGETPAGIPESVRDLVLARLRRVSDRCAEALAIASVIGERFDAALVAAAAALEDAEVVGLLEEAARAGLIVEVDAEPDGWRFSYPLMRRVAAERLIRDRRVRLHLRIGEALESRPGVSPAELAHHFGAAAGDGAVGKAMRYERLAGEHALAEVAAEVAVRHFKRALELLNRVRPQDQLLRCELLLDLAGAHDRAGEYPSRDERFADAADVARSLGDSTLLLRAARGYGGILPATVGPDPRAHALLQEALGWLGEEDSGARAAILARLAHWLHLERPYAERLELSDRSVAMARGSGDRRTLATVLMHRCWALDGPGDVDDALVVAGEILGIGAELADPELTLEGLRIRLIAQFEKGEHSAARHTAAQMKELAERVRHPEFIRLAAMWDITVANIEGRFADARELAVELGRRLQRIGHSQAQIIPDGQAFLWGLLRGHAAAFLPRVEELSASQPPGLAWPAITAWCLAEAGHRDRAAGLLGQTEPASVANADKNYLWWAVIVGFSDTADLLGDRKWAETLYDLAAPYAGHNATLGVASYLGAADHWLGVLAGVTGRFAEATRHLDDALDRHRDMGSRPLTALTQEAYGHVLSLRGQPGDAERARALTETAMRAADELGLAAIRNRPRLRG